MQSRPGRRGFQERLQLMLLPGFVVKRDLFRIGFKEKIEGIDHRHFGHQVHFQRKTASLLGEHQPRQEIPLRVLLPVDEVILRLDAQRKADNGSASVRGGAKAYGLRRKHYRPVVVIGGLVVEAYPNSH